MFCFDVSYKFMATVNLMKDFQFVKISPLLLVCLASDCNQYRKSFLFPGKIRILVNFLLNVKT